MSLIKTMMVFLDERTLFTLQLQKKMELGRYSWKASIATLKQQTADAANNDMGITTSIFQNDTCTKNQKSL